MAIELEVTAPNGVLQTIYKWANVCRWKYTSLTGFGKFDGFVCMPPNQGRSDCISVFVSVAWLWL